MGDAGELAAYVRARAADADGQSARAAAEYARALNGAPDNVVIAIRAYRAGPPTSCSNCCPACR